MKYVLSGLLAIALFAGMSLSSAEAHPSHKRDGYYRAGCGYNANQFHHRGISASEAIFLSRGQRRIDRMEDRFLSDGQLSWRERNRLSDAWSRQQQQFLRASNHPYYRHNGRWYD